MSGKNDRKIGGISKMEKLVSTPQALGSPIPGRNILYPTNSSIPYTTIQHQSALYYLTIKKWDTFIGMSPIVYRIRGGEK